MREPVGSKHDLRRSGSSAAAAIEMESNRAGFDIAHADAIHSVKSRAASFPDEGDNAVYTFVGQGLHGLDRRCEDQGKGNSDHSNYGYHSIFLLSAS
jgi:hypothetical protein